MYFNIILSHAKRSLKWPSSFRFPSKPCTCFCFSLRATYTTHLILVDLISLTIFGEQFKSLSFSLCSFHQTPATSSLLAPNIHLSTLFSITLNLCSSLIVRDKVSHTYKTTGKSTVLYVLSSRSQICITQGGKRLWTQRWQRLPEFKFFRHAILIY